jgi:phage nucleotide-binding protein
MELTKIDAKAMEKKPYTALLYCAPGVGKSTAIGLIAEASEGNTLVLDVDRTVERTLAKGEVVKDTSKVLVAKVENRGKDDEHGVKGTFQSWTDLLTKEITPEFLKANKINTVAVDNISELERCILADLGSQGKNKGVPAMADYQYMQFKLVNSLRLMKSWGVNIVWTAWETVMEIVNIDGSKYAKFVPKMSNKIVDNICGLCDVVGRIVAVPEGDSIKHGIILEGDQRQYAKNQIDTRKGCTVEDFVNFEKED